MAFDISGDNDGQLDAQLDLFLQQITEQEDLCYNPFNVSSPQRMDDPWSWFAHQEPLAQPSIIPGEDAPLANNPDLTAPSTALPQAISANSQLTPQSMSLCCMPVTCSPGSVETELAGMQQAAPLHSQATPAAFQPPPNDLLQPSMLSNTLHQAAPADIETEPAPHQPQATVLPSATPSDANLHTTTASTAGGTNKRSHAWSEKNRRAQQRFRDRQKVCLSCLPSLVKAMMLLVDVSFTSRLAVLLKHLLHLLLSLG